MNNYENKILTEARYNLALEIDNSIVKQFLRTVSHYKRFNLVEKKTLLDVVSTVIYFAETIRQPDNKEYAQLMLNARYRAETLCAIYLI